MPWSEIFRFFYLLGFVNAFFFGVLVFSKKERSQADTLLGIWLMVLALQFLWPFIYLANFEKYLYLVGYEVIIFCLHPIFLYNYIKALTQRKVSKNKIWLSFLPIALIIITFVPFFLFDTEAKKQYINHNTSTPTDLLPSFIIVISTIIYYIIASFIALKKHKNNTLHIYSYRDNVDLLWLRRLLVAYTIISVLSIPVVVILESNELSLALSDYIFYATLVIFVFFLGYWGYQQGSIFNLNQNNNLNVHTHSLPKENFIPENFETDSQKIIHIIQNQKPFLNPSLSLHDLAELTSFTPHHLSKVINKSFNKNFFEFINDYRIKEFKSLLLNPNYKSFTLLGIAFECGFNSKSAFNRIFKECTGLTPSEYKKQFQ